MKIITYEGEKYVRKDDYDLVCRERDEMICERDALRAENSELRKWLDGSKLIIANMMPKKEVANDDR